MKRNVEGHIGYKCIEGFAHDDSTCPMRATAVTGRSFPVVFFLEIVLTNEWLHDVGLSDLEFGKLRT
jgi:hypothetical protein